MQEAADDLVKLYKRISLDDDLDTQRGQLTAGAVMTAGTLRLVTGDSHGTEAGPGGDTKSTNPPHPDLSANPYFQVHVLHHI